MDEESYREVPKEIIIRAIKTKKRIIVTTPIDPELYPRKDITDLNMDRWHIELDFRCIKLQHSRKQARKLKEYKE